jgi:hypothetical protein
LRSRSLKSWFARGNLSIQQILRTLTYQQ